MSKKPEWQTGWPKKPGVYWIEPNNNRPGGPRRERAVFIGQAYREKACCKHCDNIEVYVHGGSGSMPLQALVASREQVLYLEIPDVLPRAGWVIEPEEPGLYLFKSSKHPGANLSRWYGPRCGVDYIWRDGGSSHGGNEEGMYAPIEVPKLP